MTDTDAMADQPPQPRIRPASEEEVEAVRKLRLWFPREAFGLPTGEPLPEGDFEEADLGTETVVDYRRPQ